MNRDTAWTTTLKAIALFKIGIGCHGFGVLDKAVLIEHSHGLTADGKTVAPYFEQGDGPARTLGCRAWTAFLLINTQMPSNPAIRGIIFDLDGTLVDSKLDFEAIRRDMGLPSQTPILEALQGTAPGPDLERMHAVLHSHELRSAELATLFEGVTEFLQWVDEQPWQRAILTRNSRICTDLVLDRLKLRFSHVLTREDAAPKPDPEGLLAICRAWNLPPAEVVFCGDYLFDLQAGRRAGMRTILFAPGPVPEFADQADLVLRTFQSAAVDLRTWLAGVMS